MQWYSLGILHRNYAFAGGKDTMSKVAAQLSKYLAPEPGGRATAESIDRLEAELENNPAWANYAAN